jgi:DNA-binding PucR family transcriptional regulator
MPSADRAEKSPAKAQHLDLLDELSEAVESGAGLPEVARAAARVLEASVVLIDRSSSVLAVAAQSAGEEKELLSDAEAVMAIELRVADQAVGQLRYRPRSGEAPSPSLTRMVSALLALELERSRAPERASEQAAGDFVRAVLERRVTDRGDILARAAELGADLEAGSGVLIARAHSRSAQASDWRARFMTLVLRGARSVDPGALAAEADGDAAEVQVILRVAEEPQIARAAGATLREVSEGLPGFMLTVAHSRRAADPADLYRAGNEATLAANVGEADGIELLAFEDTGAYRLLLPAMSDDPGELERFYAETIEPLAVYDEQYETELVATLEAYLENDGNVAATAQQMFTHRHTIRYRLERVRELCGHDVGQTEGREKLGLGLKAMRVLGIAPPRGPALEPGSEAGKVPRTGE